MRNKKKKNVKRKIWGDKTNIFGNTKGVYGNASGFFGDMTGVKGDLSTLKKILQTHGEDMWFEKKNQLTKRNKYDIIN
jgi:hypothetical protein